MAKTQTVKIAIALDTDQLRQQLNSMADAFETAAAAFRQAINNVEYRADQALSEHRADQALDAESEDSDAHA